MASRIDRPVKVTLALTTEHKARLEALGAAMGQPVTVAAQVAMTLGLTNLEVLYQLKDLKGVVDRALEPLAREGAAEMVEAGMPVRDPENLRK